MTDPIPARVEPVVRPLVPPRPEMYAVALCRDGEWRMSYESLNRSWVAMMLQHHLNKGDAAALVIVPGEEAKP